MTTKAKYAWIAAVLTVIALIWCYSKGCCKKTKQGVTASETDLYNSKFELMKTKLDAGTKVTVYGEKNGYYKVDCDGIYVKKEAVSF